jgi:hypothetical protein
VDSHAGISPLSGAALTHGFGIAFYVLAGTAALGALLAALMIESRPASDEPARQSTRSVLEPESTV